MTVTAPEIALARILEALEAELIGATDDEMAAALADLGMSASIKGSAALFDLKYPSIRRHLESLYGGALAEHDGDHEKDEPVWSLKNPSATSDRSDR